MATQTNHSKLPAPGPLTGQSILIDKRDLLVAEEYGEPPDSEQATAIMLARKLYETDDYLQGEFINMGTGIGVSRDFHALAKLAVDGALPLRDLATICWLT
jgi:hypothetical protein